MNVKKVICSVLISAGIFYSFATTAFAANTSDEEIRINWQYSEPSFQFITDTSGNLTARYKSDTSRVFFKLTSPSTYAHVKVLGVPSSKIDNNGNGTYGTLDVKNLTYNPTTGKIVQYARCDANKNYSIASLVKENGYTYCTLKVRSTVLYGTGKGWWSPDSSQTHNAPTYY